MKKIIIIGSVWPEPDSTAAGQRMMQIIAVFKKLNYKITFTSIASTSKFSVNLNVLGIESVVIELNNNSFDNFILAENPDIVLFDRFMTEEQFGWRVAEKCPKALRILDSEDLHFLREARANSYKNKINCDILQMQNETAKREIASIFRCDLTLIISKFEYDLLNHSFQIPMDLLHYMPMFYETLDKNSFVNLPKFQERENFFSIGNFYHEPNWNAVLELKKNYWPTIKKQLPKIELHIYGAYMPKKAFQLHNKKEGFIVKGRAIDSSEVFKSHKVLLAPLQFGAGIKGKLLESMLFGTPNVTTSIGAEAMHDKLEWNGYIADNQEEFSSNAVALYSNESIWKQAQLNGIEIINSCFNKNYFENDFIEKLNYVLHNINTHRTQNFMGQILNHHTLKSTMYMSKWIEVKNSNKKL